MTCHDGCCDCASCCAEKRFSQISMAMSQRKGMENESMDATTRAGTASVMSRAVGSGPASTHGPGCAMQKGVWGKHQNNLPSVSDEFCPNINPAKLQGPGGPGMFSARRMDGTIDPVAFYGGSSQRKHSPGCREFNGRNGYPLNNPRPEPVQFQRPVTQVTTQFREYAETGMNAMSMNQNNQGNLPVSPNTAGIFFNKSQEDENCTRHGANDSMLREMICSLEEAACSQINWMGNNFEKKFHNLQEEYRMEMERMINEIEAAQHYIVEMENGQAEEMRKLLESFDVAKNRVGLLSEYLHVQAVPHICDPIPNGQRAECGPHCPQE